MKYKSEREDYFREYFAYWQARLRDANPVRIWVHPLLALDPWLLGLP